jgi:two-component system, sensor histidine kinase and response regulator
MSFKALMPIRAAGGIRLHELHESGPAGEEWLWLDSTAQAAGDLRGLRVLIVDNGSQQHILQELLTGWGMEPVAVENANAALVRMLREHNAGRPFRLVLVDAEARGVDGLALIRAIQDNPMLAAALVMVNASGNGALCREAGYLVKPISRIGLRSAVQGLARGSTSRDLHTLACSTGPRDRRPLRVLLVEDNAVNQKVALRLLEKNGHAVTVAADGRGALDHHERGEFDVILMDLQMPEMGGLEATRLIRERERSSGAHVPIIALTAHAMKGDRERCIEGGMDDYVSKPIRANELLSKIEAHAALAVPAGGRVCDKQS